ncbi:MAG: alanine--tRNA ligase [Chthoniobacterales bacterium]
MTSAEIRQSFLDFFREKKHTIVPSSSLLPDAPNLLFTNAGMNQFVPIFLGQQKPAFDPPRAADTQKCIRAGGKHNDLDDVGLDTYHHTFFEMLGNWSFGDYFKKEAIEWAWELVVRRWKFPPERLYATVYQPGPNEPSDFDQEAHDHWARLFTAAGLDPAVHIVNGNKTDNFWMMGDTGPCGPCSELHVDLTPAGDTRGSLVNAGDARCIEIWNLVFIQFNANSDGTFTPLPARHVDTGMGFERVTAIIQGTKNFTNFTGTISNYETDIFRPIFDEIEKLSGKRYGSTLPKSGSTGDNDQEKIDVAFRVVADHIRTLGFAIADSIQPSNEGRGYVLRRILRRAVRYGRSLGFHEPFFYKLVDVLARKMGDVFPEIRAKQAQAKDVLKREEEAFNKTLDRGISRFNVAMLNGFTDELTSSGANKSYHFFFENDDGSGVGSVRDVQANLPEVRIRLQRPDVNVVMKTIGKMPVISGEAAFELYDTYGFPLDLTELMARERGLTVDTQGFEKLMEEQRARGRSAQKKETISVEADNLQVVPTKFLGQDFLETEAVVEAVLPGKNPQEINIVLDQTACYAEMGGQVGDQGLLHVPGHDRTEVGQLRVKDTQKRGDVFVHRAVLTQGRAPEPGEAVRVSVDADRRNAIQRHHTVTHLLHWALHQLVSKDATQKGSYVGPEKLTFDFSSAALTKPQVREVEKLVNDKIRENASVSWKEIPYAEAKQHSEIMQFFGDKYGDVVRVVQIGGVPNELNGYAMELCGGTHVRATSDIGSFRILSEGAIAAGIRRIEAIAGQAVDEWARAEAERQEEKFEALAKKKTGLTNLPAFETATGETMLASIDTRAAHLEKLEAEVRDWEKANAKAAEAEMQSRAAEVANELAASDGAAFRVARVPDADGRMLQAVTDALKTRFDGPIFLAGEKEGRVALIASIPKALTSRYQAGKLIQETAPLVGGKGGGRPELAQGGGTDATKIEAALARAKELLA